MRSFIMLVVLAPVSGCFLFATTYPNPDVTCEDGSTAEVGECPEDLDTDDTDVEVEDTDVPTDTGSDDPVVQETISCATMEFVSNLGAFDVFPGQLQVEMGQINIESDCENPIDMTGFYMFMATTSIVDSHSPYKTGRGEDVQDVRAADHISGCWLVDVGWTTTFTPKVAISETAHTIQFPMRTVLTKGDRLEMNLLCDFTDLEPQGEEDGFAAELFWATWASNNQQYVPDIIGRNGLPYPKEAIAILGHTEE